MPNFFGKLITGVIVVFAMIGGAYNLFGEKAVTIFAGLLWCLLALGWISSRLEKKKKENQRPNQ